VDYTILSMDKVIRPGTRELFARLVDEGHKVYVWSGVGLRWDVIRDNGLEEFVSGVFVKPTYQYKRRLPELGVDVPVDFVVDDTVEVVHAFGGYEAAPFWFGDRPDDELLRVYDAISRRAFPTGGPGISERSERSPGGMNGDGAQPS
jgi:hypothetical protein